MRKSGTRVGSIAAGSHRARVLAKRDALVEKHLYLVRPIAEHIASKIPPCFDIDDLISAGNEALVRVATRYRPCQHDDTPFAVFARHRIRGAMLDSIRRRQYEESTRPGLDHAIEPAAEASIEISIDKKRLQQRLADAISWLTPKQQEVIAAYYSPNEPNIVSVGAVLGLSEWRVVREHADAIAELRRRLKAV